MAKKKNNQRSIEQDYLDDETPIESVQDDDDDAEEKDSEDVFTEDESDLALLKNLENEDRKEALSVFAFDEEIGFNPHFDWDSVSEADTDKLLNLFNTLPENIDTVAWKKLSPVQRWCLARAASRNNLHDRFREIALSLLNSRKQIHELCIEDIYLELIRDYAETQEFDTAEALLAKFEKTFADQEETALRVKALLCFEKNDVDTGKMYIENLIEFPFNKHIKGFENDHTAVSMSRDALIRYEIGYALLSMKNYNLAGEYFEEAKNRVDADNFELNMAIDNAIARLKYILQNE